MFQGISREAVEKVIELSGSNIYTANKQGTLTNGIKLGPTTKRANKRVPVRIKPTDTLGSAPYPDGYIDYTQKATQKIHIPVSFQEARRLAHEQREFVPTTSKKSKQQTIRAAGGEIWQDESMSLWDDNDFRLFVGDLGNEVSDELLARSFSKYSSLLRAHVVRDKKSGKAKGYGFVSFGNSDDFIKAMREMNGKHIGNRPITLKRSSWKDRAADADNIQRQKELAGVAKKPIK